MSLYLIVDGAPYIPDLGEGAGGSVGGDGGAVLVRWRWSWWLWHWLWCGSRGVKAGTFVIEQNVRVIE